MSSTVTDPRHRVSDAKVKSESGSFKRAARWVLGTQPREDAETPTTREPFTPSDQSRWVANCVQSAIRPLADALTKTQQPEKPQPVQGDAALYNTHPKPQLRRLAHLALDLEADPTLGFRDCVERLHEVMDEFSAGALEEFQAQQLWERRTGEGQAALQRKALQLLAAAADGGEDAELKTARVVTASGEESEYLPGAANKILANAMRASDPKPTALQVKMTPDVLDRLDAGETAESVEASVTATAVMSPVHVDGSHPPVPLVDEVAGTCAAKALPQRHPRTLTAFEARLDEHGDLRDGTERDALDIPDLLKTGRQWLAHRGQWHLIDAAEYADSAEQVRIHLASGPTDCPHFTTRVHVLAEEQARALISEGVSS